MSTSGSVICRLSAISWRGDGAGTWSKGFSAYILTVRTKSSWVCLCLTMVRTRQAVEDHAYLTMVACFDSDYLIQVESRVEL
jgi:hypothetical protein